MHNKRRKVKRAAAMLQATLMVVSSVDLSAFTVFAEENTDQLELSDVTITGFEELAEDVSATAVEGYTSEGFCEGYSWVDGVLTKNTGDGATMCSHGDTCNGYQPAEEKSYDVDGNGTTADDEKAYEITNAGQLYWFAAYVNEGGDNLNANAYLANDITINENLLNSIATDENGNVTNDNGARKWVPIGDYESDENLIFEGVFNGNNQSIKGIYLNEQDKQNQGIFGSSKGTIKNIKVEDTLIYTSGTSRTVGGVCSRNQEAGLIENCSFEGKVQCSRSQIGYSAAGGISGTNHGTIQGCENVGIIRGKGKIVGGICGSNVGTIKDCKNSNYVTGETPVAGICASSTGGTISGCYNVYKGDSDKKIEFGICGNVTYKEGVSFVMSNCYVAGNAIWLCGGCHRVER